LYLAAFTELLKAYIGFDISIRPPVHSLSA